MLFKISGLASGLKGIYVFWFLTMPVYLIFNYNILTIHLSLVISSRQWVCYGLWLRQWLSFIWGCTVARGLPCLWTDGLSRWGAGAFACCKDGTECWQSVYIQSWVYFLLLLIVVQMRWNHLRHICTWLILFPSPSICYMSCTLWAIVCCARSLLNITTYQQHKGVNC